MIFGIGTDIIEVARVKRKLARTPGLKERLFTPQEITYCQSKRSSARHYAARFAAKEAFLKAMGIGWRDGFQFDQIEVIHDPLGKPEMKVHGKVQRFCREQGISGMQVSLAHLKDVAKAVVILEKSEPLKG